MTGFIVMSGHRASAREADVWRALIVQSLSSLLEARKAMEVAQFVVSLIGGGLAGGTISTVSGRMQRKRALRTQFWPTINNMMGHYVVRFEKSDGRFWRGTVGLMPQPEDAEFVDRRVEFFFKLPEFNELPEVRPLLAAMAHNINPDHAPAGAEITRDLKPEFDALIQCLSVIEKKLKIEIKLKKPKKRR
jgi:hypothetical protein